MRYRDTYTPDDLDRLIIREKIKNAFTPASAIAPIAGVTEQTVHNRFNRLLDRGIVQVRAIVNEEKLEAQAA